ncbi:MAG: hypothetical protein ABIT71_14950 [Vicinamibacteraceae bacterium]
MTEAARQFWIGVVSRSHIERGVAGGFLQLNKTHWGAAFHFGQLRIPAVDCATIARAMACPTLAAVAEAAATDQATAGSPSTSRSGATHSARARTSRTTSKL